ncbi:MAG: DUF5107 domain-containing protein, partial [Vicinamibacteraceae bacterium]
MSKVRIWADEVVIPTYLAGEPDKNPMFLERRVYQGSSGRVYPYPVIDRISDARVDERHQVLFLENRYLAIMVMPGFGGRIQYAYDKMNGYPFIYHNRVIKPALVGLTGPWLSGGIEFNWPQHHRPGTFCPVDYAITEQANGACTLWLSEIEPMWHLKGTLGLTLYPDKAFLEIAIRVSNPTPLPQTFHLWTNPAVHVNEHYQAIFPPDVQAVYDHGKRDVSQYPIARGEYYKVDYSSGVDISWYKNIPVPTSYMAAGSRYDFLGGYDHGKRAGILHVADHRVVPGKKQWVWGSGDFGNAWDRNLTDEDGPYAELMCGVFADNQPDFSWLHPFEEKEAKQHFFPFREIGYVRNATIHAAVSLEVGRSLAVIGVYATASRPQATIRLLHGARAIWRTHVTLSPEAPFTARVPLARRLRAQEVSVEVRSREGDLLVAYTPEPKRAPAVPDPATAIPVPAKVTSTEALYLAGLHLEQYRHATREPEDYYREALRRDRDDVRNNTALGLLLLRRGQFAKAEPLFEAAIRAQTKHNPNPDDGEAYYYLGVCLRYRGGNAPAHDAFAKAAWSAAWQGAAFFNLAQLAAIDGDFAQALALVDRSLTRNAHNQQASHLKTLLLRRLGRQGEALDLIAGLLDRDPLDFGTLNERLLILRARGEHDAAASAQDSLLRAMRRDVHTHLEIAAGYAAAGAHDEALDLLGRLMADATPERRAAGHAGGAGIPNLRPMIYYHAGYYALSQGDRKAAASYFARGADQRPDRCFPNSVESLLALQAALTLNPKDARAALYLGNLWYDRRQVDEARAAWERSRRVDGAHPTTHRNLALLYFNKQRQPQKALRAMTRAFALDRSDARVLIELDLLKKRIGVAPAERLAFLRRTAALVERRDDLTLEVVTLRNALGDHERALEILTARTFHPWEGGEGKVTGQYVVALVELAKQALAADEAARAVGLLQRAREYPPNLGEGKLAGAQENQVLYWLGVALARVGDLAAAKRHWQDAATGLEAPTPAMFYNDQSPDTLFYQGLALGRLNRHARARQRFEVLARFGQQHLDDDVSVDYFAVSLPEFLVFDEDLG